MWIMKMMCCQILQEKQASGPIKTSPKQATFLGCGKKKKKKKEKKNKIITRSFHPESRNILNCIIAFIIVFVCNDPFLF